MSHVCSKSIIHLRLPHKHHLTTKSSMHWSRILWSWWNVMILNWSKNYLPNRRCLVTIELKMGLDSPFRRIWEKIVLLSNWRRERNIRKIRWEGINLSILALINLKWRNSIKFWIKSRRFLTQRSQKSKCKEKSQSKVRRSHKKSSQKILPKKWNRPWSKEKH